jgi:hypothetical protein
VRTRALRWMIILSRARGTPEARYVWTTSFPGRSTVRKPAEQVESPSLPRRQSHSQVASSLSHTGWPANEKLLIFVISERFPASVAAIQSTLAANIAPDEQVWCESWRSRHTFDRSARF